jgi:hypothetical protein
MLAELREPTRPEVPNHHNGPIRVLEVHQGDIPSLGPEFWYFVYHVKDKLHAPRLLLREKGAKRMVAGGT